MADHELLIFDPPSATANVAPESPPLVVTGAAVGFAGQNQINEILTTAAGGTFTVNPNGLGASTSISGSANAATVQTAIEASAGVAPGDIIVTGGPLGSVSTPIYVEWTGVFAGEYLSVSLSGAGTTGLANSLEQAALPASSLRMEEIDLTPPASKPDWIAGADSEWQALADIPKHENRKISFKVRVDWGAELSIDEAFDQIGMLIDKIRRGQSLSDGIEAQWIPTGSARSVLFDVLNGDITGMPIVSDGSDVGWFLQPGASPVITADFNAKPYWRASTETLTSTTSTAAPLTSMEVTAGGDVPALGRIIVTDNATQTRRDVEWGVEGPDTYDSATALIYDSDSLVTSGFAGSGTTRSGAYDPGAAGNSVIRASAVLTTPIAVCGTGALGHVGSYRVWGRFYFARQSQAVRLSWRAGDGPYNANAWAKSPSSAEGHWAEVYLGTITVPEAVLPTQRWDGKIEAFEDAPYTATPGALDVDYIRLVPVKDGAGRSVANYIYNPGTALLAYDQFTGITLGTALNARAAPSGGSWATSGATSDFAAEDHVTGGEVEQRNTTSDSGLGRFAILGSSNYANMEVGYVTALTKEPDFTAGQLAQGVIARYVDSSNYLTLWLVRTTTYHSLHISATIAGTPTPFAQKYLLAPWGGVFLNLTVYATGFAVGRMTDTAGNPLAQVSGYHSSLATGGTLDDGKPGIVDYASWTGGSVTARFYDNFQVSTPNPEPVVINSTRSMQFRHDGVIRYDSGGTFLGQPPSYRGSRVTFPPGTSRVAVAARRVNLDVAADDNVVDSTSVLIATRDRGLVVPR